MDNSKRITNLPLETVMSERFSRYSKSIIQQRALPDVRDGLKPVQRRINYAMYHDGNTYNKAYRKSAKAVGNVMGNFHPHGDSSIYEALIHMSQNWKNNASLIDLHGNNGSIDGDSPAAMRYTEARLSKISNEMMRGINDDTVHWVLNYDETEYEPTVLPCRFPNLIVNGSTGISSGYATNIPPHNLGETLDALIYLQTHPNASLNQIMQFIKGPDFPTGGIVEGLSALKHAYETGRGKIIVKSRTKLKPIKGGKQEIYISEIPYGVNKLHLVKQMKKVQVDHKVNGIDEVQDRTDRHGLAIVVELKHNADAKGVLNYLLKNTDLQIAYHFNVVAIDDMQPKRLSLKSILMAYLNFQRQIVYNQITYNLKKTHQRQEIVQGYIKALKLITKIMKVVRASHGRDDASNNLVKKFNFTKRQANSIVRLRLYRLTNTDATALHDEDRYLTLAVKFYRSILASPIKLDLVLRHDFLRIKKEYARPRRTSISAHVQNLHVSKQVVIPDEDVVALISHNGYMKRSSWRSYKASQNDENGLRNGDYPILEQHLNTRDYLYIFTNLGHMIYRPVIELKDKKWKAVGQHISQQIKFAPNENIIYAKALSSSHPSGKFLIVSSDGYIKQTKVMDLKPKRNYRKHAFNIMNFKSKNARIVKIMYINHLTKHTIPVVQKGQSMDLFKKGNYETKQVLPNVLLLSKFGMADQFPIDQVPTVGSTATGVKGMNLAKGDKIQSYELVNNYHDLLGVLTRQGQFYKYRIADIKVGNRNRKGVHILPNDNDIKINGIQDTSLINKNTLLHIRTPQEVKPVDPTKLSTIKLRHKGKQLINIQKVGYPNSMKATFKPIMPTDTIVCYPSGKVDRF